MGPQLALRASHVQIPLQTKGKLEFGGRSCGGAAELGCIQLVPVMGRGCVRTLYLADCNRHSAAAGWWRVWGASSGWTPMLLCNLSNISV